MQNQQAEFQRRMFEELNKFTIKWDKQLREWYKWAIAALDHATLSELGVESYQYASLLRQSEEGISARAVMILCNNLGIRKPVELRIHAGKFSEVLLLNEVIAKRWAEAVKPIQNRVQKEVEIMGAAGYGLKIVGKA